MLSLRRVITKGIQTRAAAQAFHSSAPARAEEKEEVAAAEPLGKWTKISCQNGAETSIIFTCRLS